MTAPDIIHSLLGALKELPADRWVCSVDNVRKGPVKEHHVGLKNGDTAWSRWKFIIDGSDHVVEVDRQTTHTRITFDGAELSGPSLDIHPDTHGFKLVTVVRCHYTKPDGSAGEFRFDGTNASILG